MILQIICLALGILGFVKGRISVSTNRELRGGPMYAVAALFCLPLPLSVAARIIYRMVAPNQANVNNAEFLPITAALALTPIVIALIAALLMAKPKQAPPPEG